MVGNSITSLSNLILCCLLLVLVVGVGITTNNVFAQDDWLTWQDPDKQFILQYPSNWTLVPRENRFEDKDISFEIDGNLTNLEIDVYNTSSTDIREIMEKAVEGTEMSTTLIKPKLFQGIDYHTYTVSGNPAGSVTWVADIPFLGKIVRQNIASLAGDKFVGIVYDSTADDFDKYLPEVEKVIQSIQIK